MGLLDTISSVLGTGAGGAALAAAIYAGSTQLENEMRSEARGEIARLINNTQINPDARLTANLILHVFEIVFGTRHFTFRCFKRSVLVTVSVFVILTYLMSVKYPEYMRQTFSVTFYHPDHVWLEAGLETTVTVAFMVIAAAIPDYLSLYKGRLILRAMSHRPSIRKMLGLVVLDLVASVLISLASLWAIWASLAALEEGSGFAGSLGRAAALIVDGALIFAGQKPLHADDIWVGIFVLTTAVTSIWSVLVILSSLLLKVLGSLTSFMRLIRWMFDVDAHPVRVLGLVAGAIVWGGSVVYGVL